VAVVDCVGVVDSPGADWVLELAALVVVCAVEVCAVVVCAVLLAAAEALCAFSALVVSADHAVS
jgi:hypothetical protein